MLKIDDEGKARDFIKNLQDKLQAQIGKKFVFLLVGRTGLYLTTSSQYCQYSDGKGDRLS